MTLLLTKIIEQLNASVFVLITILLVSFWGVYKISRLVEKWQSKEAELKDLRKDWNNDIPYIKERVDMLFQHFINNSAVKTSSSASLSKTGENTVKAINAEGILDKNKEHLKKLINKSSPSNVYDLQQICFRVVEEQIHNLLDARELEMAKVQALKYGIPLGNALSVVAVLLRDRLIKEYGWTDPDIDKHAV
ncbi:MAG: hypothetical protein ACNYNY_02585 [Candidatus Oxydemutatoraceae bacterium WSBS_2016_MAG_OTU14]